MEKKYCFQVGCLGITYLKINYAKDIPKIVSTRNIMDLVVLAIAYQTDL